MLYIFLAFFAGYRDYKNVAYRDVANYIIPYVRSIPDYSLSAFLNIGVSEKGFLVLIYALCKISNYDVNFILFSIQLLTCIPIFMYAYKNKNRYSITMSIAIYVFYWYLISYTIMRQVLAASLILLSTCYFREKKGKTCLILFLLAISIHISAILALVIYLVMYINHDLNLSEKRMIFANILIMILTVLLCVTYKQIVYFFTSSLNILPDKYYTYVTSEKYNLEKVEPKKTEIAETVFCLIISFLLIGSKKKDKEFFTDNIVNIVFLTINLAILIISSRIININRAGYYFFIIAQFYSFNNLGAAFKKDIYNQIIAKLIIALVLIGVWIYKYPIVQEWESYPYSSEYVLFLNK